MRSRTQAPRNVAVIAAALSLFFAMAACGSLTRPSPQSDNVTDTVTVYAINGTPVDAPTGLWFFGEQAVVISSSFTFDVAFDIDAQGQLKLYTARYVAGGLSSAHSVSLQRYSGKFEDLNKAPTTGYIADSLFTANLGDVFIVQTTDPSACGFSVYSNVIYAKLEVLGVDPTSRAIKTRFTVDPNCGFFSLVPSGTPKD
jgi:hypothetical protein